MTFACAKAMLAQEPSANQVLPSSNQVLPYANHKQKRKKDIPQAK
jgi:hypothetical protein